jgi:murein DD-endopeptidase MepM/ murein hydrolase activator NlpD
MRRLACGALLLLSVAACDASLPTDEQSQSTPDTPGTQSGAKPDTARPVLANLGVRFAPYDPQTGRAGDFDFTAAKGMQKIMREFGAPVIAQDGSTKHLPELDYFLPGGYPIVAIIDGVVSWVQKQGENDYELLLQPSAKNPWWVSYDHVRDVRVTAGQQVKVGDTLAIASGDDKHGFFELMVGSYADTAAVCPLTMVAPEKRAVAEASIARLMKDWEEFKGDPTIWDEATMTRPGCNLDRMHSY